MNQELDIGGLFAPALLAQAVIAYAICFILYRVLERLRLYRFVWHRNLVDAALFLIVLGIVAALAT